MNTHYEQEKTINLTMIFVVIVVVLAVVFMGVSGCAYNRKTEDGALLSWKSELKLLPSGASDDDIALSNKAIETTTANADRTNAHTSGIEKTKALASVSTTTTTTKSPANTINTENTSANRENIRN